MAAPQRQPHSSLKERLFEEFYKFSFYEAVRLLEAANPEKAPLGEALTPDRESVRFSVKPGFAFPPSDITALALGEGGATARMGVAFLGLIGPSGLLPHWYNELAVKRNRERDYSLTDFLDIFHHRLVSLFYLAWKKNRFPVNYQPGARDRLSGHLKCLIGLGLPSLADRIGFTDESLVFFSGLLSRQVPSAAALEVAVAYFAGTRTRVAQFAQRLLPLSPEDRTRIGAANSRLGLETVCGSFVWDCQTKFIIDLGPMGYKDFARFLPSGDLLGPLFELVTYTAGLEFDFDIRVFLKREEVPPCILGAAGPEAPQLGWTTWVKGQDVQTPDDPFVVFPSQDRS